MIVPKTLAKGYQNFLKSEDGQYFVQALEDMIEKQHASAELNPELARDYTQRAKGVRLVIEHLQSVTGEVKKP